MPSLKNVAVLAALTGAALACLTAAPALAGSKAGMTQIWDPMQHTVTQTDTIHVRSFRRLVMQTGGIDLTAYAGRGELEVRCGLLNRHWCGTPVDYKLTTIHYCSPALLVWSHLYVRPSGATSWRELPHYHDAVMGDCP